MEKQIREERRNEVSAMVDKFFCDVAEKYHLTNGDVTPMQAIAIDDFVNLVVEYVAQNEHEEF